MKNKDNKFFNAYYSSKRISETYPSVSHIDVHYVRSYRSFEGYIEDKPIDLHFEPEHVIRFAVECMNADCTRVYIDPFPVISSMIAHRETEREGTMRCNGNEAPDHSYQCNCSLKYNITIKYK